MSQLNLPTKITTEVMNLAHNNKLRNHPAFRGPYPKDQINMWLPGTLFQAILAPEQATTALFALGQTDTQLLALTLHPTNPQVIALDPTTAFEPRELPKPPLTGTNSIRTAATLNPPPFLKTGHTKITMPPITPLPQKFLHAYVHQDNLLHPATIHGELTKDKEVRNSHATPLWLQAACAATETITESAMAQTPFPLDTPLPSELSTLIEANLEAALQPNHQELLDALTTTGMLLGQPSQQQIDLTTPTTPQEPRPQPTSQPRHQDTIPTRNFFTPEPRTHTTHYNQATHQPTQPAHKNFPPAKTNARRVTPQSRITPHWHREPTPSILSIQDKATQRINEILCKEDLTTADVNRLNAFAAIQNVRRPTIDKPNAANTQRLYHFLGWAGHHSIPTFHQQTDGVWEDILLETTIANREAKVTNLIAHPLRCSHPKLRRLLHPEWIKTIATFDFAPQPFAPGNKPGLGPLAFVARTMRELQSVQTQREIVAEASTVNTHDIIKTKLGSPIIPRTIHEVTEVIDNQRRVLEFLFTPRCPLALELNEVINALYDSSDLLAEIHNFQWKISAEIMWQLTHETQRYFEHTSTERDLMTGNRPRTDLQWLADDIRRGFFQPAQNKPSMFLQPNLKRDNRPTHAQPTKRQRDSPPSAKPPVTIHNKTLSPKCTAIIKAYRAKDQRRFFPLIAAVRTTLNVTTDTDLAKYFGIPEGACLRYNIFGECVSRTCQHKHDPATRTNDKHPAALAKLLSKG